MASHLACVWEPLAMASLMPFLFLFTLFTPIAASYTVPGCSGFVEASATLAKMAKPADPKLDYSHITVQLHTLDGHVKDIVQCAPNGYYFVPVYDKGKFLLQIKGPEGWCWDPCQVMVVADHNGCNKNEDINFRYIGFTLSGKVSGAIGGESCGRKETGPSGGNVSLISVEDSKYTANTSVLTIPGTIPCPAPAEPQMPLPSRGRPWLLYMGIGIIILLGGVSILGAYFPRAYDTDPMLRITHDLSASLILAIVRTVESTDECVRLITQLPLTTSNKAHVAYLFLSGLTTTSLREPEKVARILKALSQVDGAFGDGVFATFDWFHSKVKENLTNEKVDVIIMVAQYFAVLMVQGLLLPNISICEFRLSAHTAPTYYCFLVFFFQGLQIEEFVEVNQRYLKNFFQGETEEDLATWRCFVADVHNEFWFHLLQVHTQRVGITLGSMV